MKLSSQNIKNLVPKELYLAVGGNQQETNEGFTPYDAFLFKRISETQKSLVINYRPWIYGEIYVPWKDGISSTEKYWVFNTENRVLYLCLSNNQNNRVDESGTAKSVEIPSHITPTAVTYSDGYTWLPLWGMDYSQEAFLNSENIPVPELEELKVYNTFSERYEDACGTGITGTGCCCLYYKEGYYDSISGITYNSGDLANEAIWSKCYECQELAQSLNKEFSFIAGVTGVGTAFSDETTGKNISCPTTKSITSLSDRLVQNKNSYPPNSAKAFQANLINAFTTDAGIMSINIDLGGYTTLPTVSASNPKLIFVDPSGSGADVQLVTQQKGIDEYTVLGIKINSPGTGYHAPSFYIESDPGSTLINDIVVNIFPDDIWTNPVLFTPITKYSAITSLTSNEVLSYVKTTQLTKIALLQNPKKITGEISVSPELSTDIKSAVLTVYAKKQGEVFTIPFGGPGGYGEEFIQPPEDIIIQPPLEAGDNSQIYVPYTAAVWSFDGKVPQSPGSAYRAEGNIFQFNDADDIIELGDYIVYNGITHEAHYIESPEIDKFTNYFSNKSVQITGITYSGSEKNYTFNFTINTN